MNEFYVRNVVEAALLAAGKSLQLNELGQIFEEGTRPKAEDIRAALDALATDYSSRAIEIKETAAGFRIQIRKEFGGEISRLWPERPAKYSRALLETLALIAYRQPITRAEIEAVRGVAVNPNILKTVIERNWVRVVGHRDVPGRPELLGTTREFLEYFGLRSLDELPPLAELKAMGEYNLQLELPNAGPLGIDAPANDAAADEMGGVEVAAVAVAGFIGAEAGGVGEVTKVGHVSSSEDRYDSAIDDDDDAEADRTLSVEFGASTAGTSDADGDDSDDSESLDSVASADSSDKHGESGEDSDGDDDELSADGPDSRELVAALRDVDD